MAKIKAHGTAFKVDISATLTLVPGVKTFSFPAIKARTEDVTDHDSAGWAEHMNVLNEGGEFSIEVSWDPADTTQQYLLTNAGGDAQTFQIVLTDAGAGAYDFDALITGVEHSAPVDGVLSATVSFLVTGPITFTA